VSVFFLTDEIKTDFVFVNKDLKFDLEKTELKIFKIRKSLLELTCGQSLTTCLGK
jgi:hypothetical protein